MVPLFVRPYLIMIIILVVYIIIKSGNYQISSLLPVFNHLFNGDIVRIYSLFIYISFEGFLCECFL